MGVENVISGSIVFPLGSFQDLALRKAPGFQCHTDSGRKIYAHMVRPAGLEEQTNDVRRNFISVQQGYIGVPPKFGLGHGRYPVVNAKHGLCRISSKIGVLKTRDISMSRLPDKVHFIGKNS